MKIIAHPWCRVQRETSQFNNSGRQFRNINNRGYFITVILFHSKKAAVILLCYEVNINQSTIASLRQCKSKRKFDINNSRIWNIHIFYREGTFIHTGISIKLIRSQKNGPSLDWDRPRFLTCRLWSINDGSSGIWRSN